MRGIVASLLGREYVGIDLSERQINANKDNWEEVPHESIIDGADVVNPTWITGDSLHIDELIDGEFDLLFSCPPYADLEKYSDKAEDLSNMEYDDFLDTYRKIIKKSVDMLKPNSFAIFVVGDVRDKKGNYHNFIGDTVEAFKDAGMSYYNEVIVITQFGSIAMCCTKPFNTSRKVSKAHQNFLVFIKDNKNIEKINLEDSEKQEKDINNIIEKYNSDIAVTHEKMLVFTKGSPQKASEELGEVDTSTNDEFIVNLD